jgi:hypothetical protein
MTIPTLLQAASMLTVAQLNSKANKVDIANITEVTTGTKPSLALALLATALRRTEDTTNPTQGLDKIKSLLTAQGKAVLADAAAQVLTEWTHYTTFCLPLVGKTTPLQDRIPLLIQAVSTLTITQLKGKANKEEQAAVVGAAPGTKLHLSLALCYTALRRTEDPTNATQGVDKLKSLLTNEGREVLAAEPKQAMAEWAVLERDVNKIVFAPTPIMSPKQATPSRPSSVTVTGQVGAAKVARRLDFSNPSPAVSPSIPRNATPAPESKSTDLWGNKQSDRGDNAAELRQRNTVLAAAADASVPSATPQKDGDGGLGGLQLVSTAIQLVALTFGAEFVRCTLGVCNCVIGPVLLEGELPNPVDDLFP